MLLKTAPAFITTHWLNTPNPITLDSLRGKVVLLEAFQMLCPGCVSGALPQAVRARSLFPEKDLAVIGLHTVFEHHDVQGTARALEVFLHEYRIGFPVGIDTPSETDDVPKTFAAYGMQGTPTTILIDRTGKLRRHHYGPVDDMVIGAELMSLVAEGGTPLPSGNRVEDAPHVRDAACSEQACPLPAV